jgi:hypothetical protein
MAGAESTATGLRCGQHCNGIRLDLTDRRSRYGMRHANPNFPLMHRRSCEFQSAYVRIGTLRLSAAGGSTNSTSIAGSSRLGQKPINGCSAYPEYLRSRGRIENQVSMALKCWHERREQRLESLAADSIRGLPQHHQGDAKGYIVNPKALALNDVHALPFRNGSSTCGDIPLLPQLRGVYLDVKIGVRL